MTHQQFLDKWSPSTKDMKAMMEFADDLQELSDTEYDINYGRGFKDGWGEASENCPKEWSENN